MSKKSPPSSEPMRWRNEVIWSPESDDQPMIKTPNISSGMLSPKTVMAPQKLPQPRVSRFMTEIKQKVANDRLQEQLRLATQPNVKTKREKKHSAERTLEVSHLLNKFQKTVSQIEKNEEAATRRQQLKILAAHEKESAPPPLFRRTQTPGSTPSTSGTGAAYSHRTVVSNPSFAQLRERVPKGPEEPTFHIPRKKRIDRLPKVDVLRKRNAKYLENHLDNETSSLLYRQLSSTSFDSDGYSF